MKGALRSLRETISPCYYGDGCSHGDGEGSGLGNGLADGGFNMPQTFGAYELPVYGNGYGEGNFTTFAEGAGNGYGDDAGNGGKL